MMNSINALKSCAMLPEVDAVLDASGLTCPLPVLRAQKHLRNMGAGQVLLLVSTDAVSETEVPLYCEQAGHSLLHSDRQDGVWRFWLRCGG